MSPLDVKPIQEQAAFEAIAQTLRDVEHYAIDTEFVRERTFFPVLSLVQLGWLEGDEVRVALLDPFELDLTPLRPVFEGEGIALVHAGGQDVPILEGAVGAVPRHVFDTQVAAAFLGYGITSLANLVSRELDVRLEKGSQLTDWTRRPLDERALRYAASDVAYLHAIHDRLTPRLESAGRLTWVAEETALMVEKARSTRDLDEAWWKLKGRTKLRGDAKGVAQALCRWRLETAAERDVPTKRVLSDMAILGMAGRPPRKLSDLEKVRGMGSLPKAVAQELLSVVRAGQEMKRSELCEPKKNPARADRRALSALCLAYTQQIAIDNDIEPSTLASRDDVESHLAGASSRLDTGWRHALVAEPLDDLAAGRAALTARDGKLVLVTL